MTSPRVEAEISDTVPAGAVLAANAALSRWVGARYAAGHKVAVDAALCPTLWGVVEGALRAEGTHGADVRVVLDFPGGRVVTFDGWDYTTRDTFGRTTEGPTRRFPGVG